ncbi:outer membrane protein assembly factor BamB [Acinetobacter gerneri]|jgi:outer membrane protein assembly factor BamB|uniref:Outer membrane protein assembly factor BamB n=2 Tax=Acinetobacter gerneri TaxID=202952 RepID=N8Y5W5_9GAMM|nr:outer membrane protein assembly factor BamB [Acinetobacter gerneri]ENV32122.1 outer membrane assembly lipoprotein YfgL [Acinetobacter gerneri DSM 14967 = CIP 107464 = MTCC 9824]EPR83290.1 Outer membrane protein YfgL [Acinetobacter gerneri DSM 14967 = CIP 107464 = MTCC 9824]MCH4243128.1 outer membrane protein assembly factor BamB [Acinetobacter gerneri]MDQ9009290.1 outer membrane protein assembly factor BamB [Acinetobacter gerneri]MDQ9013508.1 outer membrane protein assembly factor BamB [Aci
MDRKYKIPFALAILTTALVGCSSHKAKEKEVKPNPLPKIAVSQSLAPVFSINVSQTNKIDPLRLRLDTENGVIFAIDPKGEVEAYKGKQRLWKVKVNKHGLTSGITAANGMLFVGDAKGHLYALDQENGQQKWIAQLSGAIISAPFVQNDRVITVANDGTIFANDIASGEQTWTYKMPDPQLSLRGQATPVALDPRTVLVAGANAYIYGIDTVTGIPRFQRRVAVSDGRSDIQRLIDIDGQPVVSGQYVVTVSYQGQVTVLDMASQRVAWSEDTSSLVGPEVAEGKVFVSTSDGKIEAYDLASGQKVWSNEELLNRKLSNPVFFDNSLVVGDLDGYLHLVDPDTGKLLGRAKSSGEVRTLRVVDAQLYSATSKGAMTIWQKR